MKTIIFDDPHSNLQRRIYDAVFRILPEGFKIIKDLSTEDIVTVVATDELIKDAWIEKANEYNDVLRKDNNCITTNKKKIYIDLDKINIAENINQNTKVNCLSFVDDNKIHYVCSLCFLYNDGEDVEFKKKIVKTLVAKELKKLLLEKIDSFNYSLSSLDNFVLGKD